MKDGRPGNVSFIGCQSCISMAVHGSVFLNDFILYMYRPINITQSP